MKQPARGYFDITLDRHVETQAQPIDLSRRPEDEVDADRRARLIHEARTAYFRNEGNGQSGHARR